MGSPALTKEQINRKEESDTQILLSEVQTGNLMAHIVSVKIKIIGFKKIFVGVLLVNW